MLWDLQKSAFKLLVWRNSTRARPTWKPHRLVSWKAQPGWGLHMTISVSSELDYVQFCILISTARWKSRDLSNNQLSGEIPATLNHLTRLANLWVGLTSSLIFECTMMSLCSSPNMCRPLLHGSDIWGQINGIYSSVDLFELTDALLHGENNFPSRTAVNFFSARKFKP